MPLLRVPLIRCLVRLVLVIQTFFFLGLGDYLIIMSPINNEVILVSLARHDSNLGLILIGLDHVRERIEKVFYH